MSSFLTLSATYSVSSLGSRPIFFIPRPRFFHSSCFKIVASTLHLSSRAKDLLHTCILFPATFFFAAAEHPRFQHFPAALQKCTSGLEISQNLISSTCSLSLTHNSRCGSSLSWAPALSSIQIIISLYKPCFNSVITSAVSIQCPDAPQPTRTGSLIHVHVLRLFYSSLVFHLNSGNSSVLHPTLFCFCFSYCSLRQWQHNIALITAQPRLLLSKIGATPAAQVSGKTSSSLISKVKSTAKAHHLSPSSNPQTNKHLISPGTRDPLKDDSSKLSSLAPRLRRIFPTSCPNVILLVRKDCDILILKRQHVQHVLLRDDA